MNRLYPSMLERPSSSAIGGCIAYSFFAFIFLPFFVLLLAADPRGEFEWTVWFDFGYHILNFLAIFFMFFSFMQDSFYNVQFHFKSLMKTVLKTTGLIVGYTLVLHWLRQIIYLDILHFTVLGAMPLMELEMLHQISNLVLCNPVMGTLCAVLLAPITTSCMYYATAFAPVCGDHPKRAYFVICLVLAIPRLINSFTFWDPFAEFLLYLPQLPVHLLCCHAYQETDTIWAPIATLSLSNLISVLLLFLLV